MIAGDLLGERARLTPERTALVEVATARRFTYGELDCRAECCARVWLESLGLRPGDRVGLLAHNRVEFLDAFFAAGKSGLVLVPLGTRLTPTELAYIAKDCELSALMYDGAFADTVRELAGMADLGVRLALDEAAAGDLSWADLVAAGPAGAWTPVSCAPEDTYCLLYTSGTTGRPKGVKIPHRMLWFNGYNTVASWQLRADDVSPIFTPLYHAGGLGVFLVPIFIIGGTIVLHAGFDPAEIWTTLEQEGCTVVLGVPTVFKMLMEAPEFASADLGQVRWFISGGAPLPIFISQAFQRRGVALKQGYGLTEVGVNCFAMSVEESRTMPGSIGKPLMFTQARLVDPDGAEVPVGSIGELLLRGPHVCSGYWNNPEATATALGEDGWFRTGDLARRDSDGFFFIAGRSKDMLISGGVNVYPAEIEGELLLHPKIRDAAVVGVPSETWGEVGIAFVVAGKKGRPSPADLAEFLAVKLSKYKIPKDFIFIDELPRTAYGKVVKARLVERYAQGGDP